MHVAVGHCPDDCGIFASLSPGCTERRWLTSARRQIRIATNNVMFATSRNWIGGSSGAFEASER